MYDKFIVICIARNIFEQIFDPHLPFNFYNTICGLRQQEELILHDRLIKFLPEDETLVIDFLQIEFETESINHPYSSPGFDAAAALWGAKTMYTFSQLLFYREHAPDELPPLLPSYQGEMNPDAILSADLCLRFLPMLTHVTRQVDPEDSIIHHLETQLKQWHYSGIGYPLNADELDMSQIVTNACILQLYVDRVIEKNDTKRAMNPQLLEKIKEVLGDYTKEYWKDLKIALHDDQH